MQIIRKDISFAQAEGFEPLPSQLKRNEVSQNLRVKVHAIIYKSIETDTRSGFEGRYIVGNWAEIIRDLHVSSGGYIDKFKNDFGPNNQLIKILIQSDNYIIFFDFIERIIKHKLCPNNLREQIDNALRDCGAAYRIIENCVQPITSPEEIQAIKRAINATSDDRFLGARTHLVKSIESLSETNFSESVKHSIDAVESVSRKISEKNTFTDALKKIEARHKIHPQLKAGFQNIYNYTSDENGIRHPLIDDEKSEVDETDAIFMLGACAAFVTYLINKASDTDR